MKDYLKLDYCPRVITITRRRALLEAKSLEERDVILQLKGLSVNNIRFSFSSWSPGLDTLSTDWIIPKACWVTFMGIPYHLLTYDVMDSLCCHFGKVKEFANLGPSVGGISGMRVKVSNCDVKLVPHFTPFVGLGGVVYLVRIVLDVSDHCED